MAGKQPSGKQYVAVRWFRQSDPETGEITIYEGTGDEPYTGSLDLPYLLDPSGPDGRGPLIAEKSADKPSDESADKSATPAGSGDSSSKEK